GFTIGGLTRNSHRPPIAIGQVLLVALPLALGAAVRTEVPYLAVSAVCLLFCLAAVEVSYYLASNQLRLLLTTQEKQELAQSLAAQNLRFDAALMNMSHGLCMLDAGRRLVVHNSRLCELYDIRPGALKPGMTVAEILAQSAAFEGHAPDQLRQMS